MSPAPCAARRARHQVWISRSCAAAVIAICLILALAACGRRSLPASPPPPSRANVAVTAAVDRDERASVVVAGNTTWTVQRSDDPPALTFGPGQHRVGSAIASGRYFADPAPGCYWERQSGTGGTAGETLAIGFVDFDAPQWIVEIHAADQAFQANGACGTWSSQPRTRAQANIPPGMWLVGTQVAPGTYRAMADAGCTWERLRDFDGTTASLITTELVPVSGLAFATVVAGDAGFRSNAACGTWIRDESGA